MSCSIAFNGSQNTLNIGLYPHTQGNELVTSERIWEEEVKDDTHSDYDKRAENGKKLKFCKHFNNTNEWQLTRDFILTSQKSDEELSRRQKREKCT